MTFMLAYPLQAVSVFAEESAPSSARTKVKHNQLKYVVPGKRIAIEAEFADPEGISLVRCYFKSPEEANFVFVPMTANAETYRAVLPAMGKEAATLKYVFLSVNGKKQIARTQQFEVPVDSVREVPKWQQEGDGKPIKVGVEEDKAPETVAGFSDSIEYDVVEAAARFGTVAGIGSGVATAMSSGSAGAAATGTAAGASGAAAGTAAAVTATGAGLSTGAIVAIAGGIAVAGGAAAAAGGGGGGGTTPATATYKASGTVSGAPTSGVTITISGKGTVATDASGAFTVADLPNGTYTITPTSTTYVFDPPFQTININNGDATTPLIFTATGTGSIHATW
jgi:hypothetical protein